MYKHILITTDGSELSSAAIKQGTGLASLLRAKLSAIAVTLPFHAVSLDPVMVTDTEASYREDMRKLADQYLAAVRAAAEKLGLSCNLIHREHEHPWQAIIRTAAEEACDLIVMASHGRRGMSAMFMGSQTTNVLTHSGIPVLVTRPLLETDF